jgi:hypothetical protein
MVVPPALMASKFGGNSGCSNLRRVLLIFAFGLLALPIQRAVAAAQVFLPVADTSLLEVNPDNNLGGFVGMNSGTTQNYPRTRALLRFDLTSLPTNSLILGAALQLEVTYDPPDGEPVNNATFGLHRMLRSWGEGDKSPTSQPGRGLPATPGEATWNYAFYPTNAWTDPGGAVDVDFSSVESSSQFIYGVGDSPYRFETTPELVADVAAWVNHPASNFGWMLLCDDEASNFTARRFGTREDVNNAPFLEIEYLVPPQIDSVQKTGDQFEINFTAQVGQSYEVQYCGSLTNSSWLPLTNFGPVTATAPVQVFDGANHPQRFYRLNTF